MIFFTKKEAEKYWVSGQTWYHNPGNDRSLEGLDAAEVEVGYLETAGDEIEDWGVAYEPGQWPLVTEGVLDGQLLAFPLLFVPAFPRETYISTNLSKHLFLAFGQTEIWAFLVFGLFHLNFA